MSQNSAPLKTLPPGRQQALTDVCSGRLPRHGIFIRVPALLFGDPGDSSASKNYPIPAVDLYIFEKEKMQLWRAAQDQIAINTLCNQPCVWVKENDFSSIRTFAEGMLTASNGAMPNLPPTKRAEIIRHSALMVVEDLFQNPSPQNINRSTQMVGSFVQLLMKDPRAYLALNSLSSHDPYTLQHSVGTSVNAIILGKKLGYSDQGDLNEIGIAGLLHDIGKTRIDKSIITKNGPLNEEEWAEIRQHPQYGYDMLKEQPNLTPRTLRAILEHHEDKNGSGYPKKLRPDQMGEFSQLICLCDVFNALTTDRSYSKARTPFEAFEFIRDNLKHKVNAEMFSSLVLIYGGNI
jgi:HD-GYP domain-containing protein (c-di-GMP phosphodiesterase class II)